MDRLTHHYGEISHWHPMRESNGRAAKEFLFQLARQAGYELEYDRVSEKSWNSAAAEQEGAGDSRLSRAVFDKIAVPSRAIAFRDEHILVAVKMFPDLQGAADTLEAARQKAVAEFDAGTQRELLASVHAKLLERLSAGEIIDAHALDRPAQDDARDDTR